jgi:hypothetical protein
VIADLQKQAVHIEESGDQASSFFTRPGGGDYSAVASPLPISDLARPESPTQVEAMKNFLRQHAPSGYWKLFPE